MNPNKINILSIDGGGYRDIIPIIFLMELELRSKRNISSMFNLVGGTSFGAIIAACLTYPTLLNKKKPKFMSKDILSLWNRKVPTVFTNDVSLNNYSGYKGYMYVMKTYDSLMGKCAYDGKNRQSFLE